MISKRLAIGLLLLLPFASAASGQPAPAIDETPEIESQVPGQVQLVRWDVLLDQGGADAVNKVAQPIQTASKVYQGLTCSGFELRQAIADAMANNGVEEVSQHISFGQRGGGDSLNLLRFAIVYLGNTKFPMGPQLFASPDHNDTFTRTSDGQLHIKLSESNFRASIAEKREWINLDSNPSINYEGNLAPGDAMAFMWPITAPSQKVYYQLNVFETFKASQAAMPLMQNEQNAGWWCQNGPAKLRKWAAVAQIWESQAAHPADQPPAPFVQKTESGKEIRLLALCRPDQNPWCWWDAQGNPVWGVDNSGISMTNAQPKGLYALVDVKETNKDHPQRSPATQPADKPYAFTHIDDGATEFKAGAAVDDWTELAQMNAGDSNDIDGVTYELRKPPTANVEASRFQVFLRSSRFPQNILRLSAVGPDGKEIPSTDINAGPVGFAGPAWTPRSTFEAIMTFNGLALKDVQYFRLSQRVRQWATFSDFAQQPLTPVKTDFTQDELDAAIKKLQDRDSEMNR
jgi:hypothetical protein